MNAKNVQVAFSEATDEQLRWFASTYLQLADIRPQTPIAKVKAKIAEAWTQDFIMVPDPSAAAAPPPATAGGHPDRKIEAWRMKPADRDKIMVEVMIPVNEHEIGGKDPVPLSVNGRALYVPRGQWSKIRLPYFEALVHATKVIYNQTDDTVTGRPGPMVPETVPMYNFSTRGDVPEIDRPPQAAEAA
jgi:hypothetical protein